LKNPWRELPASLEDSTSSPLFGRRGWSRIILKTADSRDSIDIAPRGGDQPTWVSDISDMPEVPANSYDTVVCHQVLEHVRRPGAAATEILRVLAPGGHAIFSVPHLSRRHELPHDYQRYTQEGLNALLVDSNFEVLELAPYGGMLSFVHHQLSSLLILPATALPVLPDLMTGVNAPISLAILGLDRLIDPKSLAPSGIVAIARKSPS
jgi:SAM-dependent methyltransferase